MDEARYQILEPSKIPKLAQRMRGWKAAVVDVETSALEWFYPNTDLLGIGLSNYEDEDYFYIPVCHGEYRLNALDLKPVIEELQRLPLMGFDIKFDLHWLARFGWVPKQDAFTDVIVLVRLLSREEHPKLDLETVGKMELGYEYQVNLKAYRKRLASRSVKEVGQYCMEDCWLTKHLYSHLKERLSPDLRTLFSLECRLTRDLYEMEARGMMVDRAYLNSAVDRLDEEIEALLGQVRDHVHWDDFNPRSPDQVAALMSTLDIKPVARTAKGKASWDRDALVEVRDQHPIAMALAKYRALQYQRSGTVERCQMAVTVGLGDLHNEYKNWGTVTGRLSGNGQQMPKGWLQFTTEGEGEHVLVWAEDELAVEKEFAIRRLFQPRPGHVIIRPDYRQIEMFVLGYYMKDPVFNRWLDSEDVHAAAALEVWGIGPDHPEAKRYRDRGKEFNFSIVYGIGIDGLSLRTGMTPEAAKTSREEYYARMPGYGKLYRRVQRILNRGEPLTNYYLREYWLDPYLAYKGVNYLVQGSSGDFVKFKLPETREIRQQLGVYTLVTTHDDYFFEVPYESLKDLPELLHALRISPFGRDLEMDIGWSKESMIDLIPYKEGMVLGVA